MLLQVPEQKEAVESEVRVHGMIRHRNVIRLIDSEIKDGYRGDATAFLVFPYYKVSGFERDIPLKNFFAPEQNEQVK